MLTLYGHDHFPGALPYNMITLRTTLQQMNLEGCLGNCVQTINHTTFSSVASIISSFNAHQSSAPSSRCYHNEKFLEEFLEEGIHI